ncbi:MAG: DUF1015 domain-containing protein [Chitinophagales bacterium]|nr:DUF1015 domain-containing protein [Chitinophagales bacterium]
MIIKPFKGFRPRPDLAFKVALNPNNLLSEPERREAARQNKYSFAHVVKPRIDFPDEIRKTDLQLFEHARDYFEKMLRQGTILRDEQPCFYIYRMSMQNHSQTGLICCLHIKNYLDGKVKKHENTRAEKEKENVLHISNTRLNSNPVFLAYNPVPEIDILLQFITENESPAYDFFSEAGVQQQVWIVKDEVTLEKLISLFDKKVLFSYIADGHHRAAAAAIYAKQRVQELGGQSDFQDHQYFLSCLFPSNQLRIYEYNRSVKSLNGYSENEFMSRLSEKFFIKEASRSPYRPTKSHRFGMFLESKWFKLKAKEGTYKNDATGVLDVTILQENVLEPILGIKDPRIDKRVDFIPGITELKELEKLVIKGKAMIAFSLYPVTMDQLFAISDKGEVMPPKSTWFEPKLMSGLIIFRMEEQKRFS